MSKPAVASAVVAVTLTLAAVATAGNVNPKRLVLQHRDLPSGFRVDGATYVPAAVAAKANDLSVARYRAWGYVRGYEVDFKQTRKVRTGVVEIASQASVYRTMRGAQASLTDSAKRCAAGSHRLRELPLPRRIAHAAHLCTITGRQLPYRIFMVLWRRGKVRGAVLVVGNKHGVAARDAIKLALRQDAQMR